MVATIGQAQDRVDRVRFTGSAEGECGESSDEDLLRDRHVVTIENIVSGDFRSRLDCGLASRSSGYLNSP